MKLATGAGAGAEEGRVESVKEYAEKLEFIDTKKITSELLDVLSRHDLAVADAIRMLEMTKNKILIKTKLNPQKNA